MENNLTYLNAYSKFKERFKSDIDIINAIEKENNVDETDGPYTQFEYIIPSYIYHLVDIGNYERIKECFKFFDEMTFAPDHDHELSGVLQFSVLENLVTNKDYYPKLKEYFTDEMNAYLPYIAQYIDIRDI